MSIYPYRNGDRVHYNELDTRNYMTESAAQRALELAKADESVQALAEEVTAALEAESVKEAVDPTDAEIVAEVAELVAPKGPHMSEKSLVGIAEHTPAPIAVKPFAKAPAKT